MASGCLDDLPQPSHVEGLRVLAVRAEPPQVVPDEMVTLDALIVDTEARPRTLHWSYCLIPEAGGIFGAGSETTTSGARGVGLDDPGSCEGRAAAGERWAGELGTGEQAVLHVPADLFDDQDALKAYYQLPEGTPLSPQIEAGLLGIAGVNLTVTLIVETDEGEHLVVNKRVNISTPGPLPESAPNQNPTDLAFHLSKEADNVTAPPTATPPTAGRCFLDEDAGLTLTRDETWKISPLNIPDPQATYQIILTSLDPSAPFDLQTNEETYFYSFFSTAGELEKNISKSTAQSETDWSIPEDAPDAADVWIVVRDARGGTSWCSSHLPITQ